MSSIDSLIHIVGKVDNAGARGDLKAAIKHLQSLITEATELRHQLQWQLLEGDSRVTKSRAEK
jgi:hypothetical protein